MKKIYNIELDWGSYWQKACLAYKGDHTPCATSCNHCDRMAKMMMQEFETLRLQWLGMKDEIGLLRQGAQRSIDHLQSFLPPKDTVTAGGPTAEIAYFKTALHVKRCDVCGMGLKEEKVLNMGVEGGVSPTSPDSPQPKRT